MFNFWKSQIDLDILCGASLLTILLRVKRLDWGLNLFKPPRWWGAQWREVDNPTSIKSRSTSRQTAAQAQGANMSHPTLFEEVHWIWHPTAKSSWIHKKSQKQTDWAWSELYNLLVTNRVRREIFSSRVIFHSRSFDLWQIWGCVESAFWCKKMQFDCDQFPEWPN